jgi:hypothetical protein
MILILYPPSWITLYPAQPLGIAMLASFLQAEGIPCRQVDLEILAHEVNRDFPNRRIPLDDMPAAGRLSDLLANAGNRHTLHEDYTSCIEGLLALMDLTGVKGVVFSIIGERQFVSASILASYFRAQGLPVLAGGCYVTQNAPWIARLGIFDMLFTGFDTAALAAACRAILSGDLRPQAEQIAILCSRDCGPALLPKPQLSSPLAGSYRRAVKAMYKTGAEHLVLQYLLDLGCPQRCSFCTRFHRKYEKSPIAKIVAEIEELAGEQDSRLFSMTTNGINFDEKRALELCRALASSTPGLAWHAYAVPDLADPELVDCLAQSGCRILRFGMESASEKMLRMFRKKFTPAQAARCFELAHRAGIWVQVSLMTGCPHENQEDIEENCRFIEQCHPYIDSIRINPFFLQRDSDIRNRPEHYGIRLRPAHGSNLGFDEIGGLQWDDKVKATIDGIHRMYSVMREHGIGFHGISCHLLLCALHENGSKEKARDWLDRVHPFHTENIPPEWVQWQIYHGHELEKCPYGSAWESNCGLIYEVGMPRRLSSAAASS